MTKHEYMSDRPSHSEQLVRHGLLEQGRRGPAGHGREDHYPREG